MQNISKLYYLFSAAIFVLALTISILALTEESEATSPIVEVELYAPREVPVGKVLRPETKVSLEVNNPSLQAGVCNKVTNETLDLFDRYLGGLEHVIVHEDAERRRGLSSGKKIYMRCLEDPQEFENVLIHEIAHSVDLTYFKGSTESGKSVFKDLDGMVYNDDPSLEFYEISWIDTETMKYGLSKTSFVSGYAMSNPYEDFAESFLMYVKYGEMFRYLISEPSNIELRKKYNFIKYEIFKGREFGTNKQVTIDALLLFNGHKSPIFDVTKLYTLV